MSHYQHPSAIVDEGAQIGEGSRVWHWVHICGGAKIGRDCSLGQNVFVGNRVMIGNNVTLEDDVFCGPSMVFTNVYNPRSAVSRKDEYRDTVVKRGATLGANSTVVCGTTVSEYAFVAAGADPVHFRGAFPTWQPDWLDGRRSGWNPNDLYVGMLKSRTVADNIILRFACSQRSKMTQNHPLTLQKTAFFMKAHS